MALWIVQLTESGWRVPDLFASRCVTGALAKLLEYVRKHFTGTEMGKWLPLATEDGLSKL
eukprot:CAMPEP_0184739050 /NCGR_PEP_ID=MMETSP0315-20130426/1843_1 /TAXON_ID=101924 /ORGANISM="Rhodosorus marinus, Strain UTEX LB 2760" /LENGTH=59 /DNA_ID=CAMNT_0027207421 /DNA_START=236 /DNA_END=412 /DNA_ORIENTATION=-